MAHYVDNHSEFEKIVYDNYRVLNMITIFALNVIVIILFILFLGSFIYGLINKLIGG